MVNSDLNSLLATENTYLYVDVGGGKYRIHLCSKISGFLNRLKSGTVRLLNNMVNEVVWVEIEKMDQNQL
jgi:exopolyphosphatase/guanosine-5'-triphosphate,3'-diphosphate pyrophosphatase